MTAATVRGRATHWIHVRMTLLRGWTLLGWAVALCLSLTGHRVRLIPGPRALGRTRNPSI